MKVSELTGVIGYMTATMSCGASWFCTKSHQRLLDDHVVAAPHVIVVEQQDEEPRCSARRAALSSSYRLRIAFGVIPAFELGVDLHRLERLDLLRLLVLAHLELVLLHVEDDLAGFLVGDDDVDADEVDAAADHRRPLRLRVPPEAAARGAVVAALLGVGPHPEAESYRAGREETCMHPHGPMITFSAWPNRRWNTPNP